MIKLRKNIEKHNLRVFMQAPNPNSPNRMKLVLRVNIHIFLTMSLFLKSRIHFVKLSIFFMKNSQPLHKYQKVFNTRKKVKVRNKCKKNNT